MTATVMVILSFLMEAVRAREITRARANFLRNDVPFGVGSVIAGAEQRQGYKVCEEHMTEHTIELEPIPQEARLDVHGVELLDLREDLAAAGVWETTFSAERKEDRRAVGSAVLSAAARRFPGKQQVHMADTSRVSGGAVYGEATVRCTKPGSGLRTGHHAFHMDSYLPGVAEIHGRNATVKEGARVFTDIWWHLWSSDMAARNLSKQDIVECLSNERHPLVTIWVALTPGEIQQQPLAVCDKRTFFPGHGELQNTSTQVVNLPGLPNATITVLRERTVQGARWYWRPRMRFGEAFLLSTTSTPHSAVQLEGVPQDAGRTSAEVRIFLLDEGVGTSSAGWNSVLHA